MANSNGNLYSFQQFPPNGSQQRSASGFLFPSGNAPQQSYSHSSAGHQRHQPPTSTECFSYTDTRYHHHHSGQVNVNVFRFEQPGNYDINFTHGETADDYWTARSSSASSSASGQSYHYNHWASGQGYSHSRNGVGNMGMLKEFGEDNDSEYHSFDDESSSYGNGNMSGAEAGSHRFQYHHQVNESTTVRSYGHASAAAGSSYDALVSVYGEGEEDDQYDNYNRDHFDDSGDDLYSIQDGQDDY